MNNKLVIGITGTIGSGKDVVAEHIAKEFGVAVFQTSSVIKDYIRAQGLQVSRELCQKYGNIMAEKFGPDYSAKVFLEKLSGPIGVMSGMRQVAQIELLQKSSKLFLIAVDAPAEIRYARVVSRGDVVEQPTLGAFKAQEQDENSGASVMRVFDCMAKADATIANDATLEDLYKKCDAITAQIKNKFNLV